ncbi:MAG: alpha/beta hydrolase family protein [Candidatus Hydrogenedentota bacterium]
MRTAVLLTIVICFSFAVNAEDLAVLGESYDGIAGETMMQEHLDAIAQGYFEERAERFEKTLESEEAIAEYQQKQRDFFESQLGGWPERAPLDAQVVDTGTVGGVRYEKIIYESLPDYPVTAILYLPDAEPPYPAVLVPCGHSNNGKASEVYQRACILLAKNGIAALIYDPIGQGERYYYLKDNGKPEVGTTMHHTLMGVGCILTGTNIAMYRIWDGMRGIDYLESRPEVDPERIGCSGNSGGGTLSSYIMALDDRVACAAPSCYLTTFERLLATIGPQDAEQDIYAQIEFGMDHADYLHMRAPKPTLICTATQDFFDIEGAWNTFREAKRLYAQLGFSERVSIIEYNDKHGFSQPRREAMAHWMSRWLRGVDEHITEPEFDVLTDEQALCTPEGHVVKLPDMRTIFDVLAERADKLAEKRATERRTPEGLREEVKQLTGTRPPAELPEPEWEKLDTVTHDGYRIDKVVIQPEPGILLPALDFVPEEDATRTVLYLHEDGKEAEAGGDIERMVSEGARVLAVDVRSMGETRSTENSKGWDFQIGPDWTDYFRAYLVGRSFVGMRVDDIMQCVRALDTPVALHAVGETAVPALHAAALYPNRFTTVTLERGIPSWDAVVRTPRARRQLNNTVHGALEVYDLPDLIDLAGAKNVTTIKPEVPHF